MHLQNIVRTVVLLAGIAFGGCGDHTVQPASGFDGSAGKKDAAIEAQGRRLLAIGADRVPALRMGGALVWGEGRISAFLMSGAPASAIGRL